MYSLIDRRVSAVAQQIEEWCQRSTARQGCQASSGKEFLNTFGVTYQDFFHHRPCPAGPQWIAVMDWLAIDLVNDDGPPAAPNTCQWLFRSEEYVQWLQDDTLPLLWIQGKPGTGKSSLSKALSMHLKPSHGKLVLEYQFASGYTNGHRSNSSSLFASLLHQLFSAYRSQEPKFDSFIEDMDILRAPYKEGPHRCGPSKLWSLVCRLLEMLPHGERILVIDALDECVFDIEASFTPAELFRCFKQLCLRWKFRIVCFSRPRPDFASSELTEDVICMGLNPSCTLEDMKLAASWIFDRYEIPQHHKQVTMDHILSNAEGSFLWARMVLLYCSDPEGAISDVAFEKKLKSCPPGIMPLYAKWLSNTSSHMSKEDLQRRQILTLLLCEHQTRLKLTVAARILSIGSPYSPEKFLGRSCRPLLAISNDNYIEFIHKSVKDFLLAERQVALDDSLACHIQSDDSHALLAKQCFQCLRDLQFASKGRIGHYLHLNLDVGYRRAAPQFDDVEPTQGVDFEYAWQFAFFHLTQITDPDVELLLLVDGFLHEAQFGHWSEYSIFQLTDLSKVRTSLTQLRHWYHTLPSSKKSHLSIATFFVKPYQDLQKSYHESEDEDRELQYLAPMRLGMWYIDRGETEKAVPIRKEVAAGLTTFLGTRHPLTLRARTDVAFARVVEGYYSKAYEEYASIVTDDEEVLGKDAPELYRALMGRGEAELYMTRYKEASDTQQQAALGYLRLFSPDDRQYLGAQIWYAYSLIPLGDLDTSLDILVKVYSKRLKKYGDRDLFAAAAQYSIGRVQRRKGLQAECIENISTSLETTKNALQYNDSIWVVDQEIELLIAFRDFGMTNEATAMLQTLDKEANLDSSFVRKCQVTHVRALLLFDDGGTKHRDRGIALLQGSVIATERKDYNRALLWILLDLAIVLRNRDNPGDRGQAEANFDGIVRDLVDNVGGEAKGGGDHEPDPPRLLQLAEKSLTLVRNRNFDEVARLFEHEKIEWYRPEDLWLWLGGPAADTTWMKPPRLK